MNVFFAVSAILLMSQSCHCTKKQMVENTTMLLDHLLEGYDARLRPNFGENPTLVDVNLNIRSMGPISEIDMAYQMDCYFRQSWVDKRLVFSGPLTTLPVSVNILDRLWKPDTHFFNGKKSYLHTVTTPNKLLRINRDGRILYSMRLTIKASCPMHLESFPMDTQSCPLSIGSHGYGTDDVLYSWTHGANKSIKMASDMTLSQFDLVAIPQSNETARRPGDRYYSSLIANFVLRRHMGYFMINLYVPCSLLVVISWVGFWINREATSDRIALGITTVLTMAFLGIDNRRDLPKVSYSTALDYFVGICFAFVLASIVQFASVHFFTKHGSGEILYDSSDEEDEEIMMKANNIYTNRAHRKVKCSQWDRSGQHQRVKSKMNGAGNSTTTNARLRQAHVTSVFPEEEEEDNMAYTMPQKLKENCLTKCFQCIKGSSAYRALKMELSPGGVNSVSKIDQVARLLFPLTFVGFHVFYWMTYLSDEAMSNLFIQ